jgi:hypothetical protein
LKALEGFSDGELPQVFRRTRLEHRILGYDMRGVYIGQIRVGFLDYLVVLLLVSRSDLVETSIEDTLSAFRVWDNYATYIGYFFDDFWGIFDDQYRELFLKFQS